MCKRFSSFVSFFAANTAACDVGNSNDMELWLNDKHKHLLYISLFILLKLDFENLFAFYLFFPPCTRQCKKSVSLMNLKNFFFGDVKKLFPIFYSIEQEIHELFLFIWERSRFFLCRLKGKNKKTMWCTWRKCFCIKRCYDICSRCSFLFIWNVFQDKF